VSVPLWVSELAGAFWGQAGGGEPFPRGLRRPLALGAFDVTVREMAGLSVRGAERYLADLGFGWPSAAADRPLRACLVAFAGGAFLFLDADDPPAEQTFSLAHEVAHFLRDYWQPRCRAASALGEGILDVLDGVRPPRRAERLHGLLRGVPVRGHVHLMARDGGLMTAAVAGAEADADRLAWELLAPEAEVRARLPEGAGAGKAASLLCEAFGLPATVALVYAAVLFPPPLPCDPLTERLKKALAARRTSADPGEPITGGNCDEPRA